MRSSKLVCILVLALGTVLSLSVLAVLHIAQAAPAATIQSMIDAAPDGGTISIAAGTYTESLTVDKTLTLTGVSSATTIIQAVSGQRVITVTSGHNLRLENLTVTGGHPTGAVGGGIYAADGSLLIVNCRIVGNSADYGGGVFQAGAGGRVDVTDSRIELNTTGNHGGGLYVNGSAALTNTLVLSNTAGWHGGGLHVDVGRTDLNGGLFSNNRAMGDNGGAVNLNNSISVTGTQFISNTAVQDGGALLQWNAGYTVTMTNAHFERNTANRDGGGLWVHGNTAITGSTFISNTADSRSSTDTHGGGVYASGGALLITSSTFRANQAQCTGCSSMYGGGVYVDTTLSATVQGSLFETNYAWHGGGLDSAQAITIRRTTFQDNSAGYGGAASVVVGADIQNSDFLRNHATNKGGGLEAGSGATLVGTRFISNTALYGGGLYLHGVDVMLVNDVIADNQAYYDGSGLRVEAGSLRLLHTTIARNIGGDGSGAYFTTDWSGTYGSVVAMTNTILVSQTVGITVTAGNTATLNGVFWYSNTANTGGAGAIAVTNDLTGTPAFAADGYHLTFISKAINAGMAAGVATDMDGEPRDAAPDIGADEFRTCWARLNNTLTDYGHVQAAVDGSTLPADVVKVAGYCPGVQARGGVTQSVYISKTVTIRGGYTTTNWTTSAPTVNTTTLDALGRDRVVFLTGGSGINVTLENLTVRGGSANGVGGGIYDNVTLTLSNAIVRDNVSNYSWGGGVYVETGHATVSGGQILSNTAKVGGGVYVQSGSAVAVSRAQILSNTANIGGGGVYVNVGALRVTDSTVSGNTGSWWGGGIVNNGSALTLTNSTLSGNQAISSTYGGGAIDQTGGATIVNNSTIVSNTAVNAARSGIWLESGTLTIGNSIVAHNGVTNNVAISGGTFTSLGYNLTNSGAGTPFTATGDLINTNPLLGSLQNNGGSTWTHALLPGSPAIDRIPFGVNGCGTTITADQRGQPRPGTFTRLCDIGAYEAQGVHYEIYLPLVIRQ